MKVQQSIIWTKIVAEMFHLNKKILQKYPSSLYFLIKKNQGDGAGFLKNFCKQSFFNDITWIV